MQELAEAVAEVETVAVVAVAVGRGYCLARPRQQTTIKQWASVT